MNTSYVFFADGFEELEALSPVDVMRRAQMPVITVSINDNCCATGAHGVTINTDTSISRIVAEGVDLSKTEWLVCPGGMPGATNLYECGSLGDLLKAHYQKGGRVAAICASPAIVFSPLGFLKGRKATCYPGMEALCIDADMIDQYVVVDGNVVTGQGPAAATEFSLKLVEISRGGDVSNNVANGMLVDLH